MRILQSEHRVTIRSEDVNRRPRTWENVLEFVALFESMPDSEWTQHAPKLRQLAAR